MSNGKKAQIIIVNIIIVFGIGAINRWVSETLAWVIILALGIGLGVYVFYFYKMKKNKEIKKNDTI